MVVYHNIVPVGRAGENMLDLAPTADEHEWALNQLYDFEVNTHEKSSG